MQNAELIKYGRYMTSLIASVILKTAPPEPFDDIDWIKLFKLSQKHDSAAIIYDAIENMELPEEARTLFIKQKNRIIARTTRQAIEADRVMGAFLENNIKLIRLKGIHIKDYYPKPYMRTFSDVDLYVSAEDREKAKPIMKKLGYELKSTIDYHDEYEKDNFFIYEIHNPVIPERSFNHAVFSDPFSKSVESPENPGCFSFKDEYLYLRLFFHLYSHFNIHGCGIRFFTDLLVFQQYTTNIDYELIHSIIKEYGTADFCDSVKKLMDFFFFGADADKDTLTIAEYLFGCKTLESYTNNRANLSFFDKFKYFLRVCFPTVADLSEKYPILKKAPVLLPVCWVRRIFYSLFFNRKVITNRANEVKKLNSKEFKDIKKARTLATKKK